MTVREISREPRPQQFILKALRETSGELFEEIARVPESEARRSPEGEWHFLQIALHLARAEQAAVDAVERILSRRAAKLPVVDLYVTPEECGERQSLRAAAYEFMDLREQLVYRLWGLPDAAWARTGEHAYRGPVSLLQIAREQHLHDLEHLWQVRNYRELLLSN